MVWKDADCEIIPRMDTISVRTATAVFEFVEYDIKSDSGVT
jgi:hypothetical protein